MRNGQVMDILKVEPGGFVDVLDMRFEPKEKPRLTLSFLACVLERWRYH